MGNAGFCPSTVAAFPAIKCANCDFDPRTEPYSIGNPGCKTAPSPESPTSIENFIETETQPMCYMVA